MSDSDPGAGRGSGDLAVNAPENPAFPGQTGYRFTYTGTDGLQVFFETHPGPVIGDQKTTELRTSPGSLFLFWPTTHLAAPDGELGIYGTAYADSRFVNQPPHVLIKKELRAGKSWKSTSRTPKADLTSKFEVEVLGKERVEIPAGAFEAWNLEYTWLVHLGTTQDWRAWYVPGTGYVKFEEIQETTLGKKRDLEHPRTFQLERIEPIAKAHPIKFPSDPRPVAELPEQVEVPNGTVSLFADYQDVWQKYVVVYLVNRTAKPLQLPAQDNDIYLKLETQLPDGSWVRAQTHRFSWCGNSYHLLELPPKHFIALLGFVPDAGERRTVRYRLYHNEGLKISTGAGWGEEIASNLGTLPVNEDLIQYARYDTMALLSADLVTLEAFLFEPGVVPEEDRDRDMHRAFDRLAKFKEHRTVRLVERFLADQSINESGFQMATSCLGTIAPDRLAELAATLILNGPKDRRRWMIKRLTSLNDEHSKAIDALLIEQARDPATPDLDGMLQFMASREVPAARQLLVDIQNDARYEETVRAKAGWLLAWTYAEKFVELEFEFIDYDNQRGLHPPGRISVSLKNTTSEKQSFTYSSPDDILAFYLQARQKTYLLHPIEARPEGRPVEVTLAPGEQHTLEVKLLDRYELPDIDAEALEYATLYATCRLKGIHDLPQLSRTGKGVNMRK